LVLAKLLLSFPVTLHGRIERLGDGHIVCTTELRKFLESVVNASLGCWLIVKGLLRRSFRNWGSRYFGSFYLRCFFAHGFPFR